MSAKPDINLIGFIIQQTIPFFFFKLPCVWNMNILALKLPIIYYYKASFHLVTVFLPIYYTFIRTLSQATIHVILSTKF